jgi:hypothetical protein
MLLKLLAMRKVLGWMMGKELMKKKRKPVKMFVLNYV